jgi:purine nucleoside permease
LQYEIDAREMPANFSTGYFPQGAYSPNDTWGYVYNTEVFSVNSALLDLAFDMIDASKLTDTPDAAAYRANYAADPAFAAGAAAVPAKVKCDVATSDVYWSGALLGDAFAERMDIWTNGSAVYCTTAQEDGAILAAMLRGTLAGKVDYGRIMVMRSSEPTHSALCLDVC